jgi:hypothetical protein
VRSGVYREFLPKTGLGPGGVFRGRLWGTPIGAGATNRRRSLRGPTWAGSQCYSKNKSLTGGLLAVRGRACIAVLCDPQTDATRWGRV